MKRAIPMHTEKRPFGTFQTLESQESAPKEEEKEGEKEGEAEGADEGGDGAGPPDGH